MKRILLLALCALLSANADARTIYVNAKRPNNNGNGLSKAKAKKTIQAAINVARAGDTILVLPGDYATPVKTANRKLRIKSTAGAAATKLAAKKLFLSAYSLDLGNGTATKVAGFTVTPRFHEGYYRYAGGVRGGNLSNCTFKDLGRVFYKRDTFFRTKLTACLLDGCYTDTTAKKFVSSSTLSRCKVVESGLCHGYPNNGKAPIVSSRLSNCLFAENEGLSFDSCVLANCTVAGTPRTEWEDSSPVAVKNCKAWNTLFYKVGAAQFKKSKRNTLKYCYRGTAPKFTGSSKVEVSEDDDYDTYEYDSETNAYRYYAKTPFDYHLQAGSPCIDKGTKAKAAKRLFGAKDLDGGKRIKGRTVDIGCYEY